MTIERERIESDSNVRVPLKDTLQSNTDNFSLPPSSPFLSENPYTRQYQIACMFPVLRNNGVERGRIPGIEPSEFDAEALSDFLENGLGCALATSEQLALDFLLNLYDPHKYDQFNLGRALTVWDRGQKKAFVNALIGILTQ